MADEDILPYESDAYADLTLRDAITDALIDDATVTVTLFTKSGSAIAGATNLSAPFVGLGTYRALIPRTISANVVLGRRYAARAVAVSGSLQGKFDQEVIVRRLPA